MLASRNQNAPIPRRDFKLPRIPATREAGPSFGSICRFREFGKSGDSSERHEVGLVELGKTEAIDRNELCRLW